MWNTMKRKTKLGKHVGNCRWRGFSQTEQPRKIGESPLLFPHEERTKQDDRGSECTYVCLDLFCDTPEFILQQIFNDWTGWKLGFPQWIKVKQVFIVFDWKEDTSVKEEEEEEGKGNSY